MKVAFVSFGFGEYCVRLASALAREVEVCLLLPSQDVATYAYLLDQAIHVQPFRKPRLRQPAQQMRMISSIVQGIRRFDPDVIHLQEGHFWFNLALPWLNRYPLVVTIHDPQSHSGDRESQKTPQWLCDFGYRRGDRFIVHAKPLKEAVIDRLCLPREAVHIVPMVVQGDDTAQAQVSEDEQLILFFGRIWAYKGLEYLIRAEPLITAQAPNMRIVIAGQGDEFAPYRRLMAHPDKFIVYNEYISDDQRAKLFRQASMVVLPYTEASQSGVIPVAYTFAKPVVATTVGGLPELVEHGRTGYLVPPRDEKALAAAIVRLLQDQELRRHMGANGKRKIDTECAPQAVAQQTLAVYNQAVGDAP